MSMNGLGITYRTQGKYADAAPLLSAVLEARARVLGPEHRETLTSRHSLARVYEAEGKYELSQPLLLQNLEARRRTLGAEHFDTMSSLSALAESYRKQGRYHEAEPLFNQLLEVRRRTLTPDNPTTLATLTSVAALKRGQRQFAAAEQYLREALNGYNRIHSDTWQRYYAEAMLGATLIDLRRLDEAKPVLAAAYKKLTERRSLIPVEDLPRLDAVREWAGQ